MVKRIIKETDDIREVKFSKAEMRTEIRLREQVERAFVTVRDT